MSLSCSCDYEWDFECGDWLYWFVDAEYLIPFKSSRRKRCCSCGKLINIKEPCNKFPRKRYPYDEIESLKKGCGDLEDCFSEEPRIPASPHYQCERCSEIFLNLSDIGYECISPNENMEDLLKEYHEISGFRKAQ